MLPIIVYAPQGAGKTTHANELLAFFKLTHLVDDWMPTGEHLSRDTLYLTHYEDLDSDGYLGGEFDVYTLDEALALARKNITHANHAGDIRRVDLGKIPFKHADLHPDNHCTDAPK